MINKEGGNILVSIVIPCYNEDLFIERCIDSLLKQKNIPGEYEIIVVDGMSTDSTRNILLGFTRKSKKVRIIDNIKRITPIAFNLGVQNSYGDFICIMGAHSEYEELYISNCLSLFNEHPEVSCVGGPIISKGRSNFGKATALAMSSSIGVGNAKHRFPEYEGYAEMACFPMFRREVFDRIGYYDESLVRNQDDEFCFRLRLNGEKIYISPKVKSEYYVRDNFSSLFRQYFNYGRWRIAVLRKHRIPIALRQYIPAFFFFVVMFFIMVGVLNNNFILAAGLPVIYLTVLIISSVRILFKTNASIAINFIIAAITLHFSYAAGFVKGLFDRVKTNG